MSRFFTKDRLYIFITNVMGVIIGIALTFGISFFVQRNKEKKEINTMMALVKTEISDNRNILDLMRKDFVETKEICGILLTGRWKTLPEDSVQKMVYRREIMGYANRSTAWKIFQNSNVIRDFEEKELIMAISDLYLYLEEAHKWWKVYVDAQMTAMTSSEIKQDLQSATLAESIADLINDKAWRKFMEDMYVSAIYRNDYMIAEGIYLSDYILKLIDDSGNYKSDIKDLSEDYIRFKQEKESEKE